MALGQFKGGGGRRGGGEGGRRGGGGGEGEVQRMRGEGQRGRGLKSTVHIFYRRRENTRQKFCSEETAHKKLTYRPKYTRIEW